MRLRRLGVALVLGLCSLPVVLFPQAATALGSCPDGQVARDVAGLTVCVEQATMKVYKGLRSSSSSGTIPRSLRYKSSTLSAAAGGVTATAEEGVGSVLLNGVPAAESAGKLSLISKLGTGASWASTAVAGLSIGLWGGNKIDDIACSHGLDLLCRTQPDPTLFTPNGDVGTDPAGWAGVAPPWTTFSLAQPVLSVGVTVDASKVSAFGTTGAISVGAGAMTLNAAMSPAPGASSQVVNVAVGALCADGTLAASGASHGTFQAGSPNLAVSAGEFHWTAPASSWGMASGACPATRGGFGGLAIYGLSGQMYVPGPGYSTSSYVPAMTGWCCLPTGAGVAVPADNLTWWLPGSSRRPTYAGADPARTLRTTASCSGGQTITADSETWHESQSDFPPFPQPAACPTGSTLAGVKVVELTTGLPDRLIWSETIPAAVQNLTATENPTCLQGDCRLGLWKITPTDHQNCFLGSTDCAAWFTDPTKADDYVCTYGSGADVSYNADQAVDLAECNAYASTFDPQQVAQGNGYADPTTGQTLPVTQPEPTTGTEPLPGDAGQSCWPTGWSMIAQPASWVLRPIECAFTWAFVPDGDTLSADYVSIKDGLGTSFVGPWFSAIGGLFGALPGDGSGCEGPAVPFALTRPATVVHPFAACSGAMKTVAGISYALSTVIIVFMGGAAALRQILASFGYDFQLGSRAAGEYSVGVDSDTGDRYHVWNYANGTDSWKKIT